MSLTRPCPCPSVAAGIASKPFFRWALSATAAAAIAACGGGGGSEPAAPANQAPTVAINGPAANTTFASGASITIDATAADTDGTVARVEFYDGTTKLGEDTSAPFQFVWTNPPAGAHSVTALAFDNAGASTVSASLALTVSAASPPPPPPPPNVAPTVSIASPANNFKPNAPATLTLVANAADSDGSVAKVEFFRVSAAAPVFDASTFVGEAAAVGTPPTYQLAQANLAAGTYFYVARATDNTGATSTSASVQVIVNALPAVSITSPAAGANVPLGATTTLRATATDADGSIAKVEFFLDSSATALGQATRVGTSNNYELAWTNPTVGAHTFIAKATDNDGAVQTTASLSVNVPANVQPTVTLDTPVAGTNAPTTLTLSASAADSDGSVTKVEFFDGNTLLGLGTFDAATSKYRLVLSARPAGTYVITAKATDNLGATRTTASQTVVIAPNVPPAVAITSAASFDLPAAVVFTATATDSDGITRVEFFLDGSATALGQATAAPYQVAWAAPVAGTHTLTAKATDSLGNTTTTAVQTVTVNPDTAGNWSTLSTAQKAGITLLPDLPIEDGGLDASEVMGSIGANSVKPKFGAALAMAAKSLATFIPTPVPAANFVACPAGGQILSTFVTATTSTLAYNDCILGGFTFYGGAEPRFKQRDLSVTPFVDNLIGAEVVYTQLSATSFRIIAQGVVVTGNGAPLITPLVPPEPHSGSGDAYPQGALGYYIVTCTLNGAVPSCTTSVNANNLWGTDLSWTGWSDAGTPLVASDDPYVLRGTVRIGACEPDPNLPNYGRDACLANPPPARHIRFEGMTNTSGRAIVYGNNGYSVVTRLAPASPGVERLQVQRNLSSAVTVGGINYPVGLGPLRIYRCAVSPATGDWSCQPEVVAP